MMFLAYFKKPGGISITCRKLWAGKRYSLRVNVKILSFYKVGWRADMSLLCLGR